MSNLNLADMSPTKPKPGEGVAIDAAQPYDSPVHVKNVSVHPTTKAGLAGIKRTDYK